MEPTGALHPTAVPACLRDHRVYDGRSRSAARAAITRAIAPHELRITGQEERFDVQHFSAAVGPISLNFLHYGAAVDITAGGDAECVCIHFPRRRTSRVRCGSEQIVASPREAAVTTPWLPLAMQWEAGSVQLILRIETAAIEEDMRALLGAAAPARFRAALGLDLAGANGMRWSAILQLLQAEIAQAGAGAGGDGARAAAVRDLVVTSLLQFHRNDAWGPLVARTAPAAAPYVRRAREFVAANLEQPITTASLAAAAGVSARSLQLGFARELGCSPSAYVRDQRLDRARALLTELSPAEGHTVTDVALQVGFSHLGRFSRDYRRRFGEPPSTTLRRGT
jgi:AraC-like DNA-binding protein